MANVIMCDSCGNLTISVAAKMYLVFNPDADPRNFEVMQKVANNRADIAMDLCEKCVDKFIQQKPNLKVLTAEEASKL